MWRLGPHSRRSGAYGLGTRLVLPWSAMRHDLGPPGQGSPFPSPGSLFSRSPSASQCRRASSAAVVTSEGSLPFLTSLLGSPSSHSQPWFRAGRFGAPRTSRSGGAPKPHLSANTVPSRGAWRWGPSWAAPGAPSTLVIGARPPRRLVRLQRWLRWTLSLSTRASPQGPSSGETSFWHGGSRLNDE